MDKLTIDVEHRPGVTIVHLHGEGDYQTAEQFAGALLPILAEQPDRIILEMTELTFIASMFIGYMVKIRHQVHACGGSVLLVGVQQPVRQALETAGLLWYFPVFDNIQTALA